MIKNYFKVALRSIWRHKLVSFISVFGLAIGLAGSMFIFLWVRDELNFDRFNINGERIYRVEEDQQYSNGIFHVTVTPWPSGPVWKEKIPEIENSCRITNTGNLLIRYNDKVFYEDKVLAVDSSFFKMFTLPFTIGDQNKALKDPQSIIISHEMAIKYFGNEDPVGKELVVNNADVFRVYGVMKNIPLNSSLVADFVVPFSYMTKSKWYSDSWSNNSIETYVLLKNGGSIAEVGGKLTKVVKDYNPNTTTRYMLFPFLRMHLHGYWGYEHSAGSIVNVWIFSSIAILVLIIACINFMNLRTAQASVRARETGLRKLNGAYRRDLIAQFYGESIIYTFIALIFAFLLVILLIGSFNSITSKSFRTADLFAPSFVFSVLLITIITAIFAGSYPALILSSYKPINVLKTGLGHGIRGANFRKITVVFQFVISIVLILFTVIVYRQLRYMQSKSLGFDKENLIYLHMRGNTTVNYSMIKQEFLHIPEVKSVTASVNPPHQIGSNGDNIWWEGKPADDRSLVGMCGVDFDYVETMGIQMKSGRTFSKEYTSDIPHDSTGTFLINEQLEKLMNSGSAVGKILKFGNTKGEIVGVMKDYNYQSVRSKIEPLAVWIWPRQYLNFIYFRIKPGDTFRTISKLEETWSKLIPQYPFEFHFVDQDIDRMYLTEERSEKLLRYFSLLAILIACTDLFGIASYSIEQRTRELGLRKALGATSVSVAMLISSEFINLLLVASVISVPFAVYVLKRYLSNYYSHINPGIMVFILALGTVFLVAALAISYQLIKAMKTDPAVNLKYE